MQLAGKMAKVERNTQYQKFALCIDNRDCDDLEKGKVYRVIQDDEAAHEGYIRIVDESSEDYLYPASFRLQNEEPEA